MPEPPTTGDEPAHDVLAAEAFAMPARDPALHHGPLVLPDDPTGIAEPHDVLAAEEFPMPAGAPHGPGGELATRHRASRLFGLAAALAILALLVRRRLRKEVTP